MRDPATWKPNPKSHRTSRITKIVQSILSPCVGPVSYTSTLFRFVAVWLEGFQLSSVPGVGWGDPANPFNPFFLWAVLALRCSTLLWALPRRIRFVSTAWLTFADGVIIPDLVRPKVRDACE